MQLEAIASCPVASYLEEETNTCLELEQIMAISSVCSHTVSYMYLYSHTHTYVLFFSGGVLQAVGGRDKLA